MELSDSITFSDLTVRYPCDPASGKVGMEIFSTALRDLIVLRRRSLRGLPYIDALPGNVPYPTSIIDPLAQVKIVGDPYAGALCAPAGSIAVFRRKGSSRQLRV